MADLNAVVASSLPTGGVFWRHSDQPTALLPPTS